MHSVVDGRTVRQMTYHVALQQSVVGPVPLSYDHMNYDILGYFLKLLFLALGKYNPAGVQKILIIIVKEHFKVIIC